MTFNVDGQVYAQPLYVPKVLVNGALHNVLYIATMANSVFAFDADNGTKLLGPVNLGPPVPAVTDGSTIPCPDQVTTGPQVGILSTPVIDPATNSLYVVSATPGPSGTYTHNIRALDITTLATKAGPVTITATYPGNGSDSNGGQVVMNQTRYLQRTGLLLSNGNVYAGFTCCGPDPQPYHGWVVSYNMTDLRQSAVFNTSPNGYEAAIWQSGRGLVGDAAGNIYSLLGNGSFDGATEFGDTFLKLSSSLGVLDWFLPPNRDQLEAHDLDPSAGGPLLTPDTNLLIGGGKDGIMYVLHPDNLGRQSSPVQSFQATHVCDDPNTFGCYQIHSTAYLSGIANPTLYVWGFNDILRSFNWVGGAFQNGPVNNNTLTSYPGAMLALSSSAGASGTNILWAVERPGVVHAFDATNVSVELWNSTQNAGRDSLGDFSKFGQPVIADGKVFVPTFSNTVVSYGLLPTATNPPTGPSDPGTGNPGTGNPGTGTSDPGTGTGNPGTGTSDPGTGNPGTGTSNPGTGNPGTGGPSSGNDVTGPTISCSGNPGTLWPPNGKSVPVTISGIMSDAGSGLNRGTGHFQVTDEYDELQPSGAVTISGNGAFSVNLSLISARNGNDSNGRQYSISISARDMAGNLGTCNAIVVVPHDRGH